MNRDLEVNHMAVETLELPSNNNISPQDGVRAIADALKNNSTLQILWKLLSINIVGVRDHHAHVVIVKAWNEAGELSSKQRHSLNLRSNMCGDVGATALAEALKFDSGLQILDLRHNRIGEKGATALAEALKFNSTLQTLNLAHNAIVNEGVLALAEALKVNSTLQTLNLSYNKLRNMDTWAHQVWKANSVLPGFENYRVDRATAFAEALKTNSTLLTLELCENRVGDEGAIVIAEALKMNRTLQTLNLHENGVGDKGAMAMAEMLKINPALQSLHLGYNRIGDVGAAAIAEALYSMSTIQVLWKSLCSSSHDIQLYGAKAIAKVWKDSLHVRSSLHTLDLVLNHDIGDEGATAIAKALKVNSTLTRLDLCWNSKIGQKGAEELAYALEYNSTLEELKLCDQDSYIPQYVYDEIGISRYKGNNIPQYLHDEIESMLSTNIWAKCRHELPKKQETPGITEGQSSSNTSTGLWLRLASVPVRQRARSY